MPSHTSVAESSAKVEINAKDMKQDRSVEKNVANKVDDSEAASPDEKHIKRECGTHLKTMANVDRAAVEVVSSTPEDELAARPSGRRKRELASKKDASRSCSRNPTEKIDGAISPRSESSNAPSIIRRPSDRLHHKIEIATCNSSTSMWHRHEEGGDTPINAFVADEPLTAIALGEEVDKEESKRLEGSQHRRKALLAVFGMFLVIFVVGLVFGVLVSKPKNGNIEVTSTTDAVVCETQKFSTPPSFLDEPAEVVSGNIDVDGQSFDVDGDTLLVAAKSRRDDISKIGYVYNKLKGKWTLGATISYDQFIEPGYPIIDVATCGEYIFISQSGDDVHGICSGSVLVYKRNEKNEWSYSSIISPDDGNEEDTFGSSLSCDGNNLVVGAVHRHDRKVMQSTHEDNENPGNRSHDGSAYMFSLTEWTGWSQIAHFNPVNSNFQQQFGYSVAISKDVAAVGSDKHNFGIDVGGSVHVYVEQNSEWTLADVLLPNDLREGDHFGISVDVDAKGNIIAGAKHRSIEAAYIFRREGETQWVEEARLEASDGSMERSNGHSVALHSSPNGDLTAAVGAFKDSEIRSGAAYIYRRMEDGMWNETRKLVPMDLIDDSYFGSSVGIREDNDVADILVGAGAMGLIYSFELC